MSSTFPYVLYYEINSTNISEYNPNEVLYYESSPNFKIIDGQQIYQPPDIDDFFDSAGYIRSVYYVEPFIPSGVIKTTIPVENAQVDIMEYSYNLSNQDLMQQITPYQILDLLYLQNNLFMTFSQTFLSDINCQTTVFSLMQIVRRMCNLTPTNMSHPLCCFTDLPFFSIFYDSSTSLRSSPCTNSYLDCTEGWYGYCTNPENFDNIICQNFYAGSYLSDGTLDFRARDTLEEVCQNIYKETRDKNELDDYYLNFCGCYLPYGVYYDFQKKYDLVNSNVGMTQCWYLPCINCSFPPIQQALQPCPSSEISNCIQDTYISLGTTGTGNLNSNNIIVNQTIEKCKGPDITFEPAYQVSDENNADDNLEIIQDNHDVPSPVTPPPMEFEEVKLRTNLSIGTKSVNVTMIIAYCVLFIALSFSTYFLSIAFLKKNINNS